MLPQKICFVDVETTGLRASYDRIIEIGILRVENNKLVKKYQTLINPGGYIPPEIVGLTGITAQELEDAPTFYRVKEEIRELLQDAVFVAHNVRFDYSFLKNEFKREEMQFNPKQFCTVKLAKALFPQLSSYNLDSIIGNFNIKCKNRHRAFDDAKVLWNFYQMIQKTISEEKLLQALNTISKKPSLPVKLDLSHIESLPDCAGVYIFYGRNNLPLYVGKSINIKERVLSHFSADHSSVKEMNLSQQVERIETRVTAGELGALLLESTLVKSLQPLYNRKLRMSQKITILKKETTEIGYLTVAIEDRNLVEVSEIADVLGVFRSKKQAKDALIKLTKEYSLCEKLLGVEKVKGECFGYRLGRCFGACTQKEKTIKYNLRFTEAFYKTKIKPWPFDKPILIKEKNPLLDKEEVFVIDKWCLLGEQFDVDTYKIIQSYLRSPQNFKNISSVSLDVLQSAIQSSIVT